jgi:hypothetical protein
MNQYFFYFNLLIIIYRVKQSFYNFVVNSLIKALFILLYKQTKYFLESHMNSVSDCCLTPSEYFQLYVYHGKNKLHFDEMMISVFWTCLSFVGAWVHPPVLCGVHIAHLFSFLCCVFVLFVFILCLVYPMLPVSRDCLHPVSCVPNVASFSGLSILNYPSIFSNIYFCIR